MLRCSCFTQITGFITGGLSHELSVTSASEKWRQSIQCSTHAGKLQKLLQLTSRNMLTHLYSAVYWWNKIGVASIQTSISEKGAALTIINLELLWNIPIRSVQKACQFSLFQSKMSTPGIFSIAPASMFFVYFNYVNYMSVIWNPRWWEMAQHRQSHNNIVNREQMLPCMCAFKSCQHQCLQKLKWTGENKKRSLSQRVSTYPKSGNNR